MLNRIFRRLFSRKWELLLLGAVVAICTLGSKFIAVDHWAEINWDMSSYSPYAPIVGVIWMLAGMGVLYLRKIRAPSLWIMFGAGAIYSAIMYWAMYLR